MALATLVDDVEDDVGSANDLEYIGSYVEATTESTSENRTTCVPSP